MHCRHLLLPITLLLASCSLPAKDQCDSPSDCSNGEACVANQCVADDGGSGDPNMISGTIGAAGGTLTLTGGPTITVPPGAVDHFMNFTIAVATASAPSYTFGPTGMIFAHPIDVAFPTSATDRSVMWTNHDATATIRLASTTASGAVHAQVVWLGVGSLGPTTGPRSITGSNVGIYTSSSAVKNYPLDATTLAPMVVSGATPILGHSYTDGGFEIDGVPDGDQLISYTLPEYGGTYTQVVETAASALDLGSQGRGRPATSPAPANTAVTVTASGLAAWTDLDDVVAYSDDAGTAYDMQSWVTSPPADGATMATYTADNDPSLPVTLISAAAGDQVAVAQLHVLAAGSQPYTALTNYVAESSFEEVAGTTSTLAVELNKLPTASISSSVAVTQFNALGATMAPPASEQSSGPFQRMADVYFTLTNEDPNTAQVRLINVDLDAGSPDTTLTGLTYGVPSGTGTIYGTADFEILEFLNVPGAPQGGSNQPQAIALSADLYIQDEATKLAAATIAPTLGPATAPLIGGRDALVHQDGVGLTPTISWSAPSLGTPVYYTVSISKVIINSGSETTMLLTQFVTSATSVQAPPGLLTAGTYYYTRITAYSAGDVTAPRRTAPAYTSAQVVTGLYTP